MLQLHNPGNSPDIMALHPEICPSRPRYVDTRNTRVQGGDCNEMAVGNGGFQEENQTPLRRVGDRLSVYICNIADSPWGVETD